MLLEGALSAAVDIATLGGHRAVAPACGADRRAGQQNRSDAASAAAAQKCRSVAAATDGFASASATTVSPVPPFARADDSSSDWDDLDEDDRSSASDASASWAIAWRAVHDDSDDPRGETFIKCLQGGEINLCVADQHQGRQLGRLPGPW